jgi:hypothetical protein
VGGRSVTVIVDRSIAVVGVGVEGWRADGRVQGLGVGRLNPN